MGRNRRRSVGDSIKTKSICPVCKMVIEADVLEEGGKILIKKTCPEHGYFEDVYWSDPASFYKFKRFGRDGRGVSNPMVGEREGCPYDCGLCAEHLTGTILANIDLTNRCNQRCPICFANAAAAGYVVEPTMEEIEKMLKVLREEEPVGCTAVQFAGGEPTVRKELPEIIRMAKDMGFSQIQVATNGLKLAKDLEFCRKIRDAGLNTLYFQFDGLKEEIYEEIRGYNALPLKLKVIENCRKTRITSVVLVQTLAKGLNDDQLGPMLDFAAENHDVIRGINVQPISFAGRTDINEVHAKRITIPDFMRLVEEQTAGAITKDDFYPVPFVLPISRIIERWRETPQVEFTVHPHCGVATYVFIEDGKYIPITRFIDVEGLMELLEEEITSIHGFGDRLKLVKNLITKIPHFIDQERSPIKVDVAKLIINIIREGNTRALAEFHDNTLFLGAMHFQDLYNIDLERVRRCGIHYAIPDGRVIPFCTYNTLHREKVEKKFAIDTGE
ncbi:MAG: tetraether lipid synthase Tes [Candidatus Syntropharchaeales archaeon]